MNKIIDSYKTEIKLISRTIWTWVVLVLALINVWILFQGRLQSFDPGGALIASAFIIQGGIFVSLILGFTLIKEEAVCSAEEVFFALPGAHAAKMWAKCLTLLTVIAVFIVLSVLVLYTLFAFYGVPLIFHWKALPYLLLYWGIPFWVSGIIGMFAGKVFKSRLVYLFFVLIWLLIGPLNMYVFKFLMSISHIDLNDIADFMNLGQTDPNTTYDPVYGLPMEIQRWLQKGIWVLNITAIFISSLILRGRNRSRRLTVTVICLLLFNIPLLYGYTSEGQVVRTKYEATAVRVYDFDYYKDHQTQEKDGESTFAITAYDIDLHSYRNLKANVKMTISTLTPVDKLFFTLYHDLKIKMVTDGCHKLLSYTQADDQVEVLLTEPVQKDKQIEIEFSYEGTSSPYFYANEQAVLLPAYFPWLPAAGAYQAMIPEGSGVVKYPHYPQNPALYTLCYTGPEPMFTNLSPAGEQLWRGEAPKGITLAAGMLTESKIGAASIFYPISLCRIVDGLPDYLRKVNEIAREIDKDLDIRTPFETARVFFLSIPRHSNYAVSTILNQGDHIIFRIERMNNLGIMYYNERTIVQAILSSIIMNKNIVNQKTEITELFEASYTQWYGIKHSLPDTDRPLLTRMTEAYDFLGKPQAALIAKELIKLIEKNKQTPETTKCFFREWRSKLFSDEQMNEDDLLNIIKNYGGNG